MAATRTPSRVRDDGAEHAKERTADTPIAAMNLRKDGIIEALRAAIDSPPAVRTQCQSSRSNRNQ